MGKETEETPRRKFKVGDVLLWEADPNEAVIFILSRYCAQSDNWDASVIYDFRSNALIKGATVIVNKNVLKNCRFLNESEELLYV